ncbi:MAG: YdeI/OmpD-associated family protein [Flavobacteriales bacterium]|nr:YdeI/OmpD-associated family protein [Flavobacteriales bacterium]
MEPSAASKGKLLYSFKGRYGTADSNVWGRVLWVPFEDIEDIKRLGKRFIITLNQRLSYHGAWISCADGNLFFYINQKVQKTLSLLDDDFVQIDLFEDLSEFGIEMLETLREVLDQDEFGWEHFRQLTPGAQRNLIHFVQNVKSQEIQMRRAFVVVDHLNSQKGKIDYKLLNAEMKAANARFKTRL